jgi:hypothetical protein
VPLVAARGQHHDAVRVARRSGQGHSRRNERPTGSACQRRARPSSASAAADSSARSTPARSASSLPSPWQGRVFHQKVGTDAQGSGPVATPTEQHFAGGAELGRSGLDVTRTIVPLADSAPLDLIDEELRAVVEDPAFRVLLEEGGAIFAN